MNEKVMPTFCTECEDIFEFDSMGACFSCRTHLMCQGCLREHKNGPLHGNIGWAESGTYERCEVIQLAEYRPHVSGMARCINCKYEWSAVAPFESRRDPLECPKCGHMKGHLPFEYEPFGEVWNCSCGNDLFYVQHDVVFCPNCGETQRGF